jgi:phosphoenolpyruvate synthase/pyruvate phosphate dikinase
VNLVIPIENIAAADRALAGGKAVALAALAMAGFRVPSAVVVSTDAYRHYVTGTGLHERILLELNRKDFADLRWEEMWDAELRIRSMFLSTPLPPPLAGEIAAALEPRFAGRPVAVRSSAPSEDGAGTSFAGLGGAEDATRGRQALSRLLLEMARHGARVERATTTKTAKVERFLASFDESQRQRAADVLDLARASYRLRDDDNIHLGRIEQELRRAATRGRARLVQRRGQIPDPLEPAEIARALADPDCELRAAAPAAAAESTAPVPARQLIGQPAGPGLATGRARVVGQGADLFAFQRGEVLVCDAVDPNMTFVVPLAAAVVERRGGMLIHGAIIAREYGLPCVTGVPDATAQIPPGAVVTVDGYLGIVTVVQR